MPRVLGQPSEDCAAPMPARRVLRVHPAASAERGVKVPNLSRALHRSHGGVLVARRRESRRAAPHCTEFITARKIFKRKKREAPTEHPLCQRSRTPKRAHATSLVLHTRTFHSRYYALLFTDPAALRHCQLTTSADSSSSDRQAEVRGASIPENQAWQ